MKTPITVLRLYLGAGAVCLAVCDCDHFQAAAAPAPIQQITATNHSPVRLARTTGLKKLESRANKGDAASQYDLGVRYSKGDGVPLDQEKAAAWYRKAAEQGLAKAQVALGHCYNRGQGVRRDYAEAVKWYQKAVDQRDVEAQLFLGYCYHWGEGVPKDDAEAAKWFRKAAEQDYRRAQTALGECYADGQGVRQDSAEAAKWFRKAADQGDALVQDILGDRYAKGRGVPQDYAQAVKWYGKAADQGNADAQCSLGECYWRGRGVHEDYAVAVKWFRKALKQGSELARTDLAQAEAQHYPFRDDSTQSEAARAAAAQRQAFDANWYKDVSEGGTSRIIQGPHQVPMPDTPTLQAPPPPPPTRSTPEVARWQGCTGTGFFVTDDGYFVTCEHVVGGASSFHVTSPSGSLPARLIKKDRTIDVAVLKVDGAFRALPVAAQSRVKLGEAVFTVGFPNPGVQGVEPKLTRGEVSSMAGVQDDPRYYQISVPVQPGNSGGALLDECGNAVGVVTSRLDDVATYKESGALPQNVNYAVKGGLVYDFLSGVPELSGKLKAPRTVKDREAASGAAERSAVLVVAE